MHLNTHIMSATSIHVRHRRGILTSPDPFQNPRADSIAHSLEIGITRRVGATRFSVGGGGGAEICSTKTTYSQNLFSPRISATLFWNYLKQEIIGKIFEKCKCFAKSWGEYPLHHINWRGRDALHPLHPVAPSMITRWKFLFILFSFHIHPFGTFSQL